MAIDLARIEGRIRERICPVCVRCTAKHACSLPADQSCALFANLATIVDIVRTEEAVSVGPYVDAVRRRICATCRHEDQNGACSMRAGLDCALDTYLPLIIDEVEQELGRQRSERGHRKETSS